MNQQQAIQPSNYDYHTIRDHFRQPLHFKRVHSLRRQNADPTLFLQIVSFRSHLTRQSIKDICKLLGPLRSVEEGQHQTKNGKVLSFFLVQFKKEEDLLKAFIPKFFQAKIRPIVAPLEEEELLNLDQREAQVQKSIKEGFIVQRNKHGQFKANTAKAEELARRGQERRRKKIRKSRGMDGYVRAAVGLQGQEMHEQEQDE